MGNLYVIGCGGIGGYLTEMLPMALSSLSLDIMQKTGHNIERFLTEAGNCTMPCCADKLVLIDKDTFNARNSIRQGAGTGSKLIQRMRSINASMIKQSYLQGLEVVGVNAYVTPGNISKIIPNESLTSKNELGLYKSTQKNQRDRLNTPVVFLCVDNLKTRYEVSKYMEQFENCLVINGGNEKTTGHVTVYERAEGVALDPQLYEVYPEVAEGTDLRPDEESCTAITPEHDQIAITNSLIANIMIAVYNKWLREGLDIVDRAGRKTRKNEVLIDTDSFTMMGLYHPLAQASSNSDK